jgi:hypothetical protein
MDYEGWRGKAVQLTFQGPGEDLLDGNLEFGLGCVSGMAFSQTSTRSGGMLRGIPFRK